MSLRKTSSKIALGFLFLSFILTCGVLNYFFFSTFNHCDPTAEKFLRTLYAPDNHKVREQFDLISDFTDAHLQSIAEVMNKDTFLKVESLTCVGFGYRTDNNIYFANYFMNFAGGEKFFSEVVFQRDTLEARAPKVLGVHSFEQAKVVEQYQGWSGDVKMNLFFVLGILLGLSTLVIGVLIIRDHCSTWIIWLIMSQTGIGLFQLNMTAGGLNTYFWNIGFPIMTFSKSQITPWTFTFMLPLFAWSYLILRIYRKRSLS